MILDIGCIIILAICVIIGMKQGFVKSLLGITSLFISIIASVYLYRPFIDLLYGIPSVSGVIDSTIESIKQAILSVIGTGGTENLPPFLGVIISGDVIAAGNEMVAHAIAEAVFSCILVIIFILLVRFGISIIIKTLNLFTKLPVIKQFNGLLGGIVGLFTGAMVCYIAAIILFVWSNTEGGAWINEALSVSGIAKHFFETNILISSVFNH